MSIVFYISGHGFGHASRDVEVINALGGMTDARILLRTAVNPDLLARTLRVPYTLLPGACDTGIVQATSIAHDDAATVRATLDFPRDAPANDVEEAALALPQVTRLLEGRAPRKVVVVPNRIVSVVA